MSEYKMFRDFGLSAEDRYKKNHVAFSDYVSDIDETVSKMAALLKDAKVDLKVEMDGSSVLVGGEKAFEIQKAWHMGDELIIEVIDKEEKISDSKAEASLVHMQEIPMTTDQLKLAIENKVRDSFSGDDWNNLNEYYSSQDYEDSQKEAIVPKLNMEHGLWSG